MAKIIKIESYDILSKQISEKYINSDNIIEIENMLSYDGKPLTRIIMTNGSCVDTQKAVEEIMQIINE